MALGIEREKRESLQLSIALMPRAPFAMAATSLIWSAVASEARHRFMFDKLQFVAPT
jgi:hypothetical protein